MSAMSMTFCLKFGLKLSTITKRLNFLKTRQFKGSEVIRVISVPRSSVSWTVITNFRDSHLSVLFARKEFCRHFRIKALRILLIETVRDKHVDITETNLLLKRDDLRELKNT